MLYAWLLFAGYAAAATMWTPLRLAAIKQQLAAGKEHPEFEPEKFPDLDIDRSAWVRD